MALIRQADTHQHFRNAVALDLGDLFRQGEQIKTAASTHAQKTVRDAEAQRAKLLAGATEEGRVRGHREGYEQGLKEGLAAGRDAAIKETGQRLAELEARWSAALASFENDRVQLLLDANQSFVALAMAAAERIVKRTVAHDPKVVESQLEALLATIARPSRLRLRVCPDDLSLVSAALPSMIQRFSAAEHIEIVADVTVSRGGCVAVSATGGEIDASIQTQLDRILDALLPTMPRFAPEAIREPRTPQPSSDGTRATETPGDAK